MHTIDLHCDLLAYLAENPSHTPNDAVALCSLPQLKKGNVCLQTLALFTETARGSTKKFQEQLNCFDRQLKSIPRVSRDNFDSLSELHFALAIENASGLIEEDEPFEMALKRLESMQKSHGPILYASLTWNSENRLGGGNFTKKGLTREGEIFLEKMDELGIAVDLSHTSDPLADDILNTIYKKELKIPAIASHSNFRFVHDMARNLPTDVALEISRLGGVIGLCLFAPFIGPTFDTLFRHIEFAESLGIARSLAFGGDYFGCLNLPSLSHYPKPLFFDEAADASCYPHIIERLPSYGKGIGRENASAFIKRALESS